MKEKQMQELIKDMKKTGDYDKIYNTFPSEEEVEKEYLIMGGGEQ